MSTGSFIEMFMTTFGWHLYEIVWGVISSTGLAYLPFFAVIIDNVIKPIESQEAKAAAATSLRRVEIDIIRIIVMMILAVSPYMSIQYGAISHTKACQGSVGTPGGTSNAGNTGTVFDDVFEPTMINSETAKVPPWFYIVMSVTGGINDSVIVRLPCEINVRQTEYELSTVKIEDPHLKREVARFVAECYKPAVADFFNNTRQLPEGVSNNDLEWIGSKHFQNTFYRNEYAKNPVPGFSFSQDRPSDRAKIAESQGNRTLQPEYGYPSCHEWWASQDGLRKRLVDEVPPTLMGRIRGWAPDWAGVDTTDTDNLAIRQVMKNEGGAVTDGLTLGGNMLEVDANSPWDVPGELAGNLAGGIGAMLTQALLKPALFMIKEMAPYMQATLLMATYFLLPWVLLVGNYEWSTIKTATITIFAIKFWTSIWAVVDLLDNKLAQALRAASGHSGIYSFTGQSLLLGAIIDILILSLYIGLPYYFLSMLGWSGERGAGAATSASNQASQDARGSGNKGADMASNAVSK